MTGLSSAKTKPSTASPVQPLLTRVESAVVNGPATVVSAVQVGIAVLAAATPAQSTTTGSRTTSATGNVLPIGAYGTTATPAAAATTAGSTAPPVAEQIGHAIQARLETAPDQGRIDFHLSLQPPELGQIRVQLTLSNQTLTARLTAQDGATRQLIQKPDGYPAAALAGDRPRAGDH